MTQGSEDRPRINLDAAGQAEQRLISEWAVLASWAWMELALYGEMPESVRQELIATWSVSWLGDKRMEGFGLPE